VAAGDETRALCEVWDTVSAAAASPERSAEIIRFHRDRLRLPVS
jgi:hypothetical protein